MRIAIMLAASSLVALASGAAAQTVPATESPQPSSTGQPPASDPQADADPSVGGDIVVTAQRRTERLRDVPIAITVIGGDTLRDTGATQVADIQQFAPSLKFLPVPQTPSFSIRGITTNSFDYGIESAVGLAIDDVNLTLPRYVPLTTLADVERVEVLRGPQGLLFGKNTTAGLISITTRRPQLGEFSNEGRVQYGSRNQLQVYDIVNLPVGDNLALRLRAGYQYQDAIPDVRGPGRIEQTRAVNFNGKLLWEPTDRLTIYAIGDYQESNGDPGVWTVRSGGNGTFAPAVGSTFVRAQLAALGIVPSPRNNATGIGAYNYSFTRSGGGQISLDYDLGGAVVTSVTAYRDVNQRSNLEVDATPLPVYDNNFATLKGRQVSEELRIASTGTRTLDYVAGLYYWNQRLDATNGQYGTLGFLPSASPILLSPVGGQLDFRRRNESYAAFAQGTLHLGSRLRLIAGGRYTRDVLSNTTGISALPNVCSLAFAATGGRVCQAVALPFATSASRREGGWSARGGIEYQVLPTTNVYATYSRGYKGPAISQSNAVLFAVEPETVDAFELGVKTDLLDRRLSINLAAFSNKFHDFQAQVFDPTVPPQGVFRTGNAGGILNRGIEAEATARPFAGFSLTGGVTYVDSKYTDYFPVCYAGQTAAQGCTLPGPSFDAKGFPTMGSSKWSTSLAGAFQTDIGSAARAFANADWSYRSSVFYGVGDPRTIQPGFSLVNASIGIGDRDGRTRVSVFARNLFDKRFAALIFPGYFDTGQSAQILPDAAFRRIGASLDWRF